MLLVLLRMLLVLMAFRPCVSTLQRPERAHLLDGLF